jgi:hypothetical protein
MTSPWAAILFFATALILFGGGIAITYEGWAVLTGHQTISDITHNAIGGNTWLAFVIFGLVMLLFGALITHFVGWSAGSKVQAFVVGLVARPKQ